MKIKSYKIYTFGCKVNQYDSGYLSALFQGADMKEKKQDADFAIINTCAVTKTAIAKSSRMIGRAKKENPKARIFLIGCFPQVYREQAKLLPVDKVFGVKQFAEILKEINHKNTAVSILAEQFDRTRYFLKIQDGCEQFCSYCIIPHSRGKLQSRSKKEILKEAGLATELGYREIVLTGIHLGLFGKDKPKHAGLVDLLRELVKIKNLGRIRLSSIEINEVSEEMIKLIKASDKICPHLHIPLQSGSNKILRLMNRPYSADDYARKIISIRRYIPEIAITTDIIVGFPGETKNDFAKTLELVKRLEFSRTHVFPYSLHELTPAAKLPHHLDAQVKNERAKKLRSVGEILSKKYAKKFKGKNLHVIVEKISENELSGKSEYYFDVNCKDKNIIKGIKIKPKEILCIKY